MRNSIVPLIAAVIIFAIGVALIRPTVDRGQGGPEVNPGILRLPKRDPLRTASAELSNASVAQLASGSRDDGRWRVVVITGDDREPMTHAAMLALGEALFTAGVVAVMDPLTAAAEPTPPLPLPADRIIRIATRTAVTSTPSAPWQATVVFAISEPRLPAGHPAAGLQPASLLTPSVVEVSHDAKPVGSTAPNWPKRWAATGRSVVQAMLGTLVPPPGPQRPADNPPTDWGTPLPFPPTTPELRWSAAFQHDLVRGWYGRITGLSASTKSGGSEAASQPLLRLLPRGGWEVALDEGGWRQWTRLRDGQRQHFAIRDESDGWSCSMWVERPDLVGLIDRLLAARTPASAEQLERLLAAPALPEAQRVRIEQAGR